jgi:hypothetical protein
MELTGHWIERSSKIGTATPGRYQPLHCAILVLRQVTVVTVIEEINGEADDKPDGKPQPGITGRPKIKKIRRSCAERSRFSARLAGLEYSLHGSSSRLVSC